MSINLDREKGEFNQEETRNDDVVIDPEEEKALIRRVDLRLLIILGCIYAIALIDRTNIGVARVAGMGLALDLHVGERYSIISMVFFVPYIIFELPSNILIRVVGCRNLIVGIVIAWGAVTLGMGWMKTWIHLLVCRALLGFFEAGFFPGCVFLISCWYTRYETAKRMALFYLTSMVVAGFSQILSYAFTLLGGRHGIAGWRWIFIIFGAITIGLGIIGFFVIVDFPDKAEFLNEHERQVIKARIQRDRGDAIPDKLTFATAGKHLLDWKIWSFGLCFMCSTSGSYAFSYFLPVILAGGGYDTRLSLTLSAPPYISAAIYTFVIAYFSDRTRIRAPFIALSAVVCMVGLFIMAYANGIGVRYFGSFVAIAGCQSNVPGVLAYQANNVLSHSKRAVASAVVIGLGGVGGIYSTLVFRQVDAPGYIPGLWATIACQIAILVLLTILSLYFRSCNKKADRGELVIEGVEKFRYTI